MTDTTQPEALRLAVWLETSPYHHDKVTVATELRRLRVHEVNAELLEALQLARDEIYDPTLWTEKADLAIRKATGESE